MKQKVGFMGLGIMGTAMAANILKAGYPVTVYNRTIEKAEPLVQQGAGPGLQPQGPGPGSQMSSSPWSPAPRPFTRPPLGAGRGRPGPSTTAGLHQHEFGVARVSPGSWPGSWNPPAITFVDAPVSGTKKPAEDGALVILAARPPAKVPGAGAAASSTMGKKVIYCGNTGQGSMMKMFINLLLGVMMEGFAEALNFGRLGGLDLDAMLETVFSGAMNAPMFQVKAPNIRENNYPPAFPLKHLAKDAKFVLDTAFELGAPVPAGQVLLHLYRLGVAKGWGDEDISAIAKVLEHLNPKA